RSKERLYKAMAIALAISLVISWAGFYAYYVSVQPLIKPPEQPLKQAPNPFQVQGIISVYKNGILVHQGPDLLTNSFYEYLPFLLGNICALGTNNAPTSCPDANWASNVFTAPPQALSCSVSILGGFPASAPSRVPVIGETSQGLIIGIGTSTILRQGDCLLSLDATATASIAVYSPFTNNANNPPAPCPNPTQGCVQISAQFSFGSGRTLREAALYAAYSIMGGSLLYTLIAHDNFRDVNLNPGDTLTVIYTFIFPGVQTNAGAYSTTQGAIAALFGQCLGRQYFGIGSGTARLCLDAALPTGDYALIHVYTPSSPCSDTAGPTGFINRGGKITIEANAASNYVKIYAPMAQAGSGIQMVKYSLVLAGPSLIEILIATQSCSVATQQGFQQGEAVGLQLNFP
ncbi:MAG: hypothetical protein C4294_19975, partial [Nitrospiraceae bacterium]